MTSEEQSIIEQINLAEQESAKMIKEVKEERTRLLEKAESERIRRIEQAKAEAREELKRMIEEAKDERVYDNYIKDTQEEAEKLLKEKQKVVPEVVTKILSFIQDIELGE
ncbi:MAG: hypothetical protein ACTSYD_13685 [Candidatus Heimdallarchaeaceae archaeon]